MALTLFTVSVSACLEFADPDFIEVFASKFGAWGFMDPAITYGAGILSFTAQLPAGDAITAATAAITCMKSVGAETTHIEVSPCLQTELVPESVAV